MKHADLKTLLGFAAGALTTLSYLPQVVKTWKSRSTRDISAGMFVILAAGLLLWTLYGFLINSTPVIVTNIVSFILAVTIVVFKMLNG
ncbi:MAG: SemiSWEET transporter [Nitrospiraceae bacterium]|nr:SemiSWEET transporter [Nitrospiraceae bacterium]